MASFLSNVTTDYLLLDDNDQYRPYQNINDRKLLELFEEFEKMEDKETIISLIEAYIANNKK